MQHYLKNEGEIMSYLLDSIPGNIREKSLDALWMRGQAIANNIANSDTPGYKEKTVSFEESLQAALSDNNITKSELENVNPTIVEKNTTYLQNGVDMENQMIELSRVQLQYQYMLKASTGNLLKIAVNNGNG